MVWYTYPVPTQNGSGEMIMKFVVPAGGVELVEFVPPVVGSFYELSIGAKTDGDANPFYGVDITFNDDDDSGNYMSHELHVHQEDDSGNDVIEQVRVTGANGIHSTCGVPTDFPDVISGNLLNFKIQNVSGIIANRAATWESGFSARNWEDIRETDYVSGNGEWLSSEQITKITIKSGFTGLIFQEGSTFVLRVIL